MTDLAPGVWLYFVVILFPAVFVHFLLPVLVGIKRIFPRVVAGILERVAAFFSTPRGRIGILIYDACAMLYIVRYAVRQLTSIGTS